MPNRIFWPTAILIFTTLLALVVAVPLEKGSLETRAPSGPVIATNFPDPCVIQVGSTWYAFATRTKGTTIHLQVASSPDFNTWTVSKNADGSQKDAMPKLPAWVNQTNWNTWAPSVAQISKNQFVMYFAATTTQDTSARFHCVGWATATNIEGPYTGSPTSFICPLQAGGAIDPTGFQDTDGKRYVVYKEDGNSIGNGGACGNDIAPYKPTWLTLQPLAQDGTTMSGTAVQLLSNDGAADNGIVEAPSIVRSPAGKYFLFFSKGCFTTGSYTVSYATADKVTGPYTRQPKPLFQTGDYGLVGPGGADIDKDAKHVVFHSFTGDPSAFLRAMHTAEFSFNGTSVTAL